MPSVLLIIACLVSAPDDCDRHTVGTNATDANSCIMAILEWQRQHADRRVRQFACARAGTPA
jgi:hypothetical protein